MRILYGGWVKPATPPSCSRQPDIDGALVGGASLDPGDFAAIARRAAMSSAGAGSDARPVASRS